MIDLRGIGGLYDVCGGNLGGLDYVRILPAENLAAMPLHSAHTILSELDLLDGANYLDIVFSPDSGGYDEALQETEHGDFQKQKLELWVPRDTPEVGYWMERLTGIRCVAIYQDSNGVAKLIGSKRQPLRFSHKLETGQGASSKNGHLISFSGECSHKALYYQMFEVPPAGTRKVFSAGFNFGFRRV